MNCEPNKHNNCGPSPFLDDTVDIETSKRHLPHWQVDGGFYFVTWHLADSLPQDRLRQWKKEKRDWLLHHPKPWASAVQEEYRQEFPRRLENWLDAGYGECPLRMRGCAKIVADTIMRFDGHRYDVASFVIMPNHVHALFRLLGGATLELTLQGWKGVSARKLNELLGRRGSLWQQESRDTSIRNPVHLIRCYVYIQENPAKAQLRENEYIYYEAAGFKALLRAYTGDFDGD
jgi:REP element-mobilizing transposase RayT